MVNAPHDPTAQQAGTGAAAQANATRPVPDWLRPLYPFTPKVWRTPRGALMSYLDEGPQASGTTAGRADGPGDRRDQAVLMVHGNPTWSFYYRELVSALAPTQRCIVPDHIGMGLSAQPQDYPYNLETRIDDLVALVRALGLRRVRLVVHDWGGAIGCGLAARLPGLVERLVILNTAAFPLPHIPRRIALCKTGFPGTWLVRGLNGFAGPAVWMSMHRRRLTALERRGFLLPYDSWANRVAVDAFVKDIPMERTHPTWPVLAGVADSLAALRGVPALILWGGRDFCFHDAFLAEWRRRLPEAQVHRLADAGHYVLADAADEVLPLLTRFLD